MGIQRRRGMMGRGLSAWEQSNIVVGRAVPAIGKNDYVYVFPSGCIKVRARAEEVTADKYVWPNFNSILRKASGVPIRLQEDERGIVGVFTDCKDVEDETYRMEPEKTLTVFYDVEDVAGQCVCVQARKGKKVSVEDVFYTTFDNVATRKKDVYVDTFGLDEKGLPLPAAYYAGERRDEAKQLVERGCAEDIVGKVQIWGHKKREGKRGSKGWKCRCGTGYYRRMLFSHAKRKNIKGREWYRYIRNIRPHNSMIWI